MAKIPIENLNDNLIEYLLNELSSPETNNEAQNRMIKTIKLSLQERKEGKWDIVVGMGIAEAIFDLTGKKTSGSIGGTIERLISYWISRPFNQDAFKNLLDK